MPQDYRGWLQKEAAKHAAISKALTQRENMDALDDIIKRHSEATQHEARPVNSVSLLSRYLNNSDPATRNPLPEAIDLNALMEVGKSIIEVPKEDFQWPQLKPGNINNCLQHASVEYLVMEYARMCRLPDYQLQPSEREFFYDVEARLLWPNGQAVGEYLISFRSRVANNNAEALRLVRLAIRRANVKKMLGPLKAQPSFLPSELKDYPYLTQPSFLPSELKDYPYLKVPYAHNGLSSNETVLLRENYSKCCRSWLAEESLSEGDLAFIASVEGMLEWPAAGAERVRSLNKFRHHSQETSEEGNKAIVLADQAISSAPISIMRKRLEAIQDKAPAKQPLFLDQWHTLVRRMKSGPVGLCAADVAAMLEAMPETLRPDWRVAEVIDKTAIEVWENYYREMQTDTGGSEISAFLRRVEDYGGVTDRQKFRRDIAKTVRDLMSQHGFLHVCLAYMRDMKTACLKEACRYLDDKDKSGTRKHLTQAVLYGMLPKEALAQKM